MGLTRVPIDHPKRPTLVFEQNEGPFLENHKHCDMGIPLHSHRSCVLPIPFDGPQTQKKHASLHITEVLPSAAANGTFLMHVR